MEGLQEVIAIAGIIAGIITAFKGIQEYRRSITFRRAEWLYSLYRDFYIQPYLKEIREEMDSEEGRRRIEQIIQKEKLVEKEEELLSNFTDYLNFFEFMLHLRKTGALKEEDVKAMFDYYLKLFYKSKTIIEYLSKTGYEYLAEHLKRYETS
ncbi:MAG: hypothetical protein QXI59_04860 [Candidatus Bathyarchaeia archaeon]